MSEITREELNAMTQAYEKSATALEKIANQLEQIALKTDKLCDKLDNGMSDAIIAGVTTNYNQVHKETIDTLARIENFSIKTVDTVPVIVKEIINNSSISKNMEHIKWFVGIVGIVIIISTVIIRGLDTRLIMNKDIATLSSMENKIDINSKIIEQILQNSSK